MFFSHTGCCSLVQGQQKFTDSLRVIINRQKADTAAVNALADLANEQIQIDSAINYAQQGLSLAKKINYKKGEADCFFCYRLKKFGFQHEYPKCLNGFK